MKEAKQIRQRHKDRLDAHYTVTEGGKYTPRKLSRWRYRPHDIAEYLEMLQESQEYDGFSAGENSQAV